MKILYLIRGAQGSGKSTLAKALTTAGLIIQYLEADMYFVDRDGCYKWDKDLISTAHGWCQASCELLLRLGQSIAIANTFTTRKELKPYYDLAVKYGYKVQEIVLMNPIFQNEHNVPPEIVNKFQERLMNDLRGPQMNAD